MALKAFINSLEEVADSLRSLYKPEGNGFVLELDDKDFKSKLSEFRNSNIDLKKKLEGYEGTQEEIDRLKQQVEKYGDLDPDKAKEAFETMQALEEKKLIDAGQIDEVVEQRIGRRIERMQSDYDGKISALQKALDSSTEQATGYRSKLESVVIDSSLQSAIAQVGPVRKGAMQDVLSRGRSVWKLDDDGNPIPMRDGEVMYGKDGKQPISMEEWGQSLLAEAAYLFEANAGGGAGGNIDTSVVNGVVNAGDQDSINGNIEAIAKGEVVVQG